VGQGAEQTSPPVAMRVTQSAASMVVPTFLLSASADRSTPPATPPCRASR
jgi:hypothetical protein